MWIKKRKKRKRRFRKKRSFLKNKNFYFGIIVLFLLLFVGWLFLLSPIFNVEEVRVEGATLISSQKIKSLVIKRGQYSLGPFLINNIFVFPSSRLEKAVEEEFPPVKKAEIKKVLPRFLEVNIQERKKLIPVCREKECFVMDEDGVLFLPLKDEKISPPLYLNKELFLGEKIFSEREVEKIIALYQGLREIVPVEGLFLEKSYIFVQTTNEGKIFFDLKDSIKDQLFNLVIILEKEIPPENREKLEYIDLRWEERVFYKYKE